MKICIQIQQICKQDIMFYQKISKEKGQNISK